MVVSLSVLSVSLLFLFWYLLYFFELQLPLILKIPALIITLILLPVFFFSKMMNRIKKDRLDGLDEFHKWIWGVPLELGDMYWWYRFVIPFIWCSVPLIVAIIFPAIGSWISLHLQFITARSIDLLTEDKTGRILTNIGALIALIASIRALKEKLVKRSNKS